MGLLTHTHQTHAEGLLMARWVLPVNAPPLAHGFVRWQQGRIVAVGLVSDLCAAEQASYNPLNTHILTPGLINTHTHLELTYPNTLPIPATHGMGPWLRAVVAMGANNNTPLHTRVAHGLAALVASGTTYFHDVAQTPAEWLPLVGQMGLAGQVALEFFHARSATPWQPAPLQAAWQAAHKALKATDDIVLGLSPHSVYNVHPQAWQQAVQALQPAFIHTHLAESADEQAWLAGQPHTALHQLHTDLLGQPMHCPYPTTSITQYLQHTGLYQYPARFAHGVFCTAAELAQLQQWGWQVLHCPRSNLHLSQRTLMAQHWPTGVVPLGTDSLLSSPDLDLRAEDRIALTQQSAWCAEQALTACTWHGAIALGQHHQRGQLNPGYWADLVLWNAPELTEENTTELNSQKVHEMWLSAHTKTQAVVARGLLIRA
jgi:cytosine/adenosine deaminase-related metal-dependent hydrolase